MFTLQVVNCKSPTIIPQKYKLCVKKKKNILACHLIHNTISKLVKYFMLFNFCNYDDGLQIMLTNVINLEYYIRPIKNRCYKHKCQISEKYEHIYAVVLGPFA